MSLCGQEKKLDHTEEREELKFLIKGLHHCDKPVSMAPGDTCSWSLLHPPSPQHPLSAPQCPGGCGALPALPVPPGVCGAAEGGEHVTSDCESILLFGF